MSDITYTAKVRGDIVAFNGSFTEAIKGGCPENVIQR